MIDCQDVALGCPAQCEEAVRLVLSLLSAERSLTTKAVTVTDLAAAAAVAGAIVSKRGEKVAVVHDDFRLVATGAVQQAAVRVGQKRIDLVARKLELMSRKTDLEADLEIAKAKLKDAEKAVDDAQPKPGDAALARRNTARNGVADVRRQAQMITVRLSLVESLLATIDAFVAAIRVVPTGGRRTPLATAALYQALHDTSDTGLTHVLLIKAQPGQSAQLTSDKPLMFADKFSVMVEVNVTYILITVATSWVVKSGTATALAMAHGNLGDEIKFHVRTPVVGVDPPAVPLRLRSNTWQPAQLVGDLTTDDE